LSLIQDLRREDIHAIGVNPDGDKILRMVAQTAPIEAGAVHLPLHAPWLDEFKKEVLSFPKGRHDDQIDALSQGLQRAFAPKPSGAGWATYGVAICALLSVGVVVEKGPPARSPRGVTRIQTEKLRSAESYVPADGTCAAPSLLWGLRLPP
jgi:hypothetical protein